MLYNGLILLYIMKRVPNPAGTRRYTHPAGTPKDRTEQSVANYVPEICISWLDSGRTKCGRDTESAGETSLTFTRMISRCFQCPNNICGPLPGPKHLGCGGRRARLGARFPEGDREPPAAEGRHGGTRPGARVLCLLGETIE